METTTWWRAVTDLLVPDACRGCDRPGPAVCEECAVPLAGPVRVARSGAERPGLPVVHAAARYEGPVRRLLLAHKERGAVALARPLGEALALAVWSVCGAVAGELLLVPVPSARRAVRARGHDPLRRVALAAARVLRRWGRPVRTAAVLRHVRTVRDQADLDAAARARNVAGAFAARGSGARILAGRPVVVVDDLVTTGASVHEAARAVTVAGGDVLAAAVVATAGRHGAEARAGPGEGPDVARRAAV